MALHAHRILFMAFLGLVACRDRPERPQKAAVVAPSALPVPRTAELTPTDRAVLETVLLDMLADPKLDLHMKGAQSQIVLNVRTPVSVGMLGYVLNDDLVAESVESVPRPLSDEIFRRNRNGGIGSVAVNVSFAGLALDRRIVIAEVPPRAWLQDDEFPARHPDAKAWAEAYLPAYEADGRSAFSQVAIGPSPHGAKAQHLLVLENGRWIVRWKHYAFYA